MPTKKIEGEVKLDPVIELQKTKAELEVANQTVQMATDALEKEQIAHRKNLRDATQRIHEEATLNSNLNQKLAKYKVIVEQVAKMNTNAWPLNTDQNINHLKDFVKHASDLLK